MTSTAIANMSEKFAAFNSNAVSLITSMPGDSFEERTNLVRVVENAAPIQEHVGETISLVHVVVERAEFVNEQTGEFEPGARVTMIDTEGRSYVASSKGVLNSVQRLFSIVGNPDTWEGQSVPVKVVQRGKAPRAYYTFEYVTAPVAAKK